MRTAELVLKDRLKGITGCWRGLGFWGWGLGFRERVAARNLSHGILPLLCYLLEEKSVSGSAWSSKILFVRVALKPKP